MIHQTFIYCRKATEEIISPLFPEDTVLQPEDFISPPKWHLGHTTWFFDEFVLKKFEENYQDYQKNFSFIFNSYYQSCGDRVARSKRGTLSRPTLQEVMDYRHSITERVASLIDKKESPEIIKLIKIGCEHEKQHQELLWMDIKYILSLNPLNLAYLNSQVFEEETQKSNTSWLQFNSGDYTIGHNNNNFAYDNEKPAHQTKLNNFEIRNELVSNREFLEFIEDGAYNNFKLWHDEAWEDIQKKQITHPLYWKKEGPTWKEYQLNGWQELKLDNHLCHISYYEAFAFANWKGSRLPTEFEWEAASDHFKWGQRWEWTESAYLPYPNFKKEEGSLGEYNGKFMVNQMVLRGASVATPENHSRKTYRNFFHPPMRWMFSGIRLARSL